MTDGKERRIADDTQLVFMARTLERLFGTESIDVLVKYNLEKTQKTWEKKAKELGRKDPGYLLCLFNEDAHEFEVIRNDADCLEVKVTKCVHADVFKSFNAADIGEKFTCSTDDALIAGYNPMMKLTRPCTLMKGKCCHFIFELKSDNGSKLKRK